MVGQRGHLPAGMEGVESGFRASYGAVNSPMEMSPCFGMMILPVRMRSPVIFELEQGTDWNGTKLSPAFGEFPLKSAIYTRRRTPRLNRAETKANRGNRVSAGRTPLVIAVHAGVARLSERIHP